MEGKIEDAYRELNPELRMLLFTVEKVCGLEVGGARVFNEERKIREVVDARYIFMYVSVRYLEYSHGQICDFLKLKWKSSVANGVARVEEMIRYNVAYRNRVYNIAVECGVMPLVKHIINIVD